MKRALCALASCLAVPSAVLAISTKSFVIDTSEAFEKGKLEGVASYSTGLLRGAITTERTAVEGAPVATSSVLAADDSIYIGTGHDGAVYKVSGATHKLFAKTDAAAITSLALQGDTLYLGSIPKGRVFSVDVRASSDGKPKELGKLEGAEHVWGLAYDTKASLLYAATGPEGKLFSIDASGNSKLIYDDAAEHLLSLALDADGSLLVGTSHGARLLRIKGTQASVVHDFPGQELSALSIRGGLIAVAVNEFSDPAPLPPDPTRDLTLRLKRPKPGKGKLYALSDGGRVDELYAADNGHITAVEIEASGDAVLAGLSQDGRIVRATLTGERALWADVDERQVVSLGLSSRTPYFVTSDGIAVYRAKPNTDGGTWTSAVLDAKFPARWGELNLRSKGKLSVQTRSGNTETPDATWSDWSAEASGSAVIRSVKGRFLQVRAKLTKDAELYGLAAYYLADNQPARVKNVRLKAPKKDPKPDTPAAKPAESVANHSVTLSWDTDNPDDDKLRYRLYYRRDEQTSWLTMLPEHEVLDQNDYSWDTRAVPDGRYRVRVVATDELVNPKPYVRSMEATSAPLLVDNHAPEITELSAKGRTLSGRIVDTVGPVSSIEVSFDGKPYAPLFPLDDLLDTQDERFSVELGELAPGTHIASVRATDAAQNIGSKAIEFTIER